jgi:hypothetical protein
MQGYGAPVDCTLVVPLLLEVVHLVEQMLEVDVLFPGGRHAEVEFDPVYV